MRYRFGPCELVPASHEFMVDGKARPIEPQVFDLIRAFVENPGRLFSHDDLIQLIWDGRIVSDSAINARISAARSAIGDTGAQQTLIKTVPRRGYRFVGSVEILQAPESTQTPLPPRGAEAQRVRLCTARDGTAIAFATTGQGQPFVRAGHWLTHLEHDWHSPVWRPFLDELDRHFQVTRYDQRGNGLSDRKVAGWDLDDFVADLEAVVDAAGLERFVLYGTSQGAPIAVSYAARNPERVSHLILHGGYVRGRLVRPDPSEREQGEALLALIRHGWGKAGSPFLRAFTSMYIPDGTREQIDSLIELQRITTTPENAAALRAAVDRIDVSDLLRRVASPTMILHACDDGVQPLDEGRALAAGIPGAELVMLDSANHTILSHEPAWSTLFDTILRFTGVADYPAG